MREPGQLQLLAPPERTDDHARITINDDGAGIDAAFLPFVFDRFRQGDSGATRSSVRPYFRAKTGRAGTVASSARCHDDISKENAPSRHAVTIAAGPHAVRARRSP